MSKKFGDDRLTLRQYNFELRADEGEEGVIEGVPIVYGQRTRIIDWAGEYDEIIDRSALDKTDLKDVLLFTNHDTNKIALARSKNGKGTMQLEKKDDGLHIKATLDIENNADARSLYSAIKRQDVTGMSFMFRVRGDEWKDVDKDVPTRVVKDISIVHEVSVVNFPAYAGTSVNARSSSQEGEYSPLAEARKAYSQESDKLKAEQLECEKLKYQLLMEV